MSDVDVLRTRLEDVRAEYKSLVGSWEYAFAMAHGCSMNGTDPRLQPYKDREQVLAKELNDLKAQLKEFEVDEKS